MPTTRSSVRRCEPRPGPAVRWGLTGSWRRWRYCWAVGCGPCRAAGRGSHRKTTRSDRKRWLFRMAKSGDIRRPGIRKCLLAIVLFNTVVCILFTRLLVDFNSLNWRVFVGGGVIGIERASELNIDYIGPALSIEIEDHCHLAPQLPFFHYRKNGPTEISYVDANDTERFAPSGTIIQSILPLWVFLLASIAGLIIVYRRSGYVKDNLTCECGYSLLGNLSGKCPECGRPLIKSIGEK